MRRTLFVLAALTLLVACSAAGAASRECSQGSDCASGICQDDGSCAASSAGGAAAHGGNGGGGPGGSGGAAGDGQGGGDPAGGATSAGGSGGGQPGVCSPNGDGMQTRAETPLGAGLSATFQVATNAKVTTAGTTQPDGTKLWDFTAMQSGDHASKIEALPIAGMWFQGDFPGATYAMRLADGQDLMGVFEVTDSSLLLRGIVSSSSAVLTKTELTYSPPVTVLAFPLTVGAEWTTQSTITGTVSGVPGTTTFELYQNKVDLAGSAAVPFGTFPVLRVSVVLTRTVGALVTVQRTFLWTAECFGTVAKAVSQSDELNTEFTTASELGRLSP